MTTDPQSSPRRPFSHYLLVSMILLIILVAAGITAIDYLQAKQQYEQNAAFLQVQTEENIIRTIGIIDAGFRLFDESQNEKLQDGFSLFMAGYEAAGNDPARMDLERLREKIGGNVDLYIINESNVIEYTTYGPDLGLDFRTVPYFSDYLTTIRQSEGYFSDRVVNELTTGQLRKFAYMPSPDNRYVFEIGLTVARYDEQHSFDEYQRNTDQIVALNPFVRDVMVYDVTKQTVNRSAPPPDAETGAQLDRIISERKGLEVADPAKGTKTVYLFIDLFDERYGSDVSRIVKITYDTSLIQSQLNDLLLYHFLVGALAVIAGIVAAILLSRFLTAPIYQIVSDVDIIARGNLGHTISPPAIGREFEILERSVSTMVSTLTTALERERKSEVRYRRLVENIPDVVWTSTEEGKTVFISKNVTSVYGYAPDEIYAGGASLFLDRIHPDDRAMVRAELSSLFSNKKYDIEYRIRHKDGRWIWLHDRSMAVYERDGKVYADGVFSDITMRREAEERLRLFSEELEGRVRQRTSELAKTEEAFRQANKKLNLLSSITRHDILNQLTILTGYIKLAEGMVPEGEVQKYLATAKKAAEVIDRHMVFTRLYQNVGVREPTWQNVQKIIQDIRRDFPREKVLIQEETGELELYADPLLEKVFFTLIENSLRHGERVTLVRISFTLGDNDLTLVYEDNGTGINPHEKERIFEWGYGKHTGFGLFLSREILAITGLTIKETGEAGKGVRFGITVPPHAFRFRSPSGEQ